MKYKLSEIMTIIGGGTPKTTISEYWNGDIPWLSVKDFNNDNRYVYDTEKKITQKGLENSSTKLLEKDDIIISARGTVGELAMIPYPMAFNQSCYGLRANPKIVESAYLYYLLKNTVNELKNNTHGSVFDTITKDTFSAVEVEIPPIKEQIKISSILKNIDDKIALNQQINNNLEQQAQAIFKYWFVDFEPFKDEDFIDSELGKIPNGWEISNLTDIAEYLNGLAMQKFRPLDGEIGIPVMKIKELRQGCCDNSSELCSPNIKNEYIIHDGDVIFSWSGSLLVDIWCGGICGLNQHLFKVSSNKYDKWFYYMWTKYHLNRFIAIASDKATTMGHIKREELNKAKVLIPSKADYSKINSILKPIFEMIILNRIENQRLIMIRDHLIPKLMTGEIQIPLEV